MREQLIAYRGNRSQGEMAKMYEVTQQAWSKWERGVDAPRPHVMKAISDDTGIAMEVLFFDVFNNHELLKDALSKIANTG